MIRSSGRVACLFFLCSVSGLRAQDRQGAQDDWATVKTKHYEVTTDAGSEVAQSIANYMEKMYLEYSQLYSPPDSNDRSTDASHMPRRFRVELFSDQQMYLERQRREHRQRQYVRKSGSAFPTYHYHHYGRNHSKNVVTGFLLPKQVMQARLRHEGWHQYLRNYINQPPQWLNEGIAECLEGYDFREKTGLTSAPNRGFVRRWREGLLDIDPGPLQNKYDYLPLEELLLASKPKWLKTKQVSYAQSWGVCYFLLHGGSKYQGLLAKCLAAPHRDATRSENTRRVFQAAFSKIDFPQFEHDYQEFFKKLKLPGHQAFAKGIETLRRKAYPDALDQFNQAIEADSGNERYYYYRGVCFYSQGQFDDAKQDLETATALFPEYSAAHFVLGKVYYYLRDHTQAKQSFAAAQQYGGPSYARKAAPWLRK